MIADLKHFQEAHKIIPSQVLKKPIKVVMSNGEYHIARRSGDNVKKKDQDTTNNNINNNINNNNNNINNNTNSSNNTKAYFGSPVPMFGGTFPCGSPFYSGPPTPPLDDWSDQESAGVNDVEFVDDERNFTSHEAAKKFQQQQQQQGLVFFPCGSPRLDDYLSASSSDDDDDEVCRLMFMTSTVANNNNNNNNIINNNGNSNSINTRSRTSQRFGQSLQGHVTSSSRGQSRDQTNACSGVQHGRVHKRFRAIDVTSVGNQRPSLNFRKMRRSSFHRKHHRLTDRLSNQPDTDNLLNFNVINDFYDGRKSDK